MIYLIYALCFFWRAGGGVLRAWCSPDWCLAWVLGSTEVCPCRGWKCWFWCSQFCEMGNSPNRLYNASPGINLLSSLKGVQLLIQLIWYPSVVIIIIFSCRYWVEQIIPLHKYTCFMHHPPPINTPININLLFHINIRHWLSPLHAHGHLVRCRVVRDLFRWHILLYMAGFLWRHLFGFGTCTWISSCVAYGEARPTELRSFGVY